MNKIYPGQLNIVKKGRKLLASIGLFLLLASTSQAQLTFKNSSLETGVAGNDNSVYRFPIVATGVDALVKIKSRSSTQVKLVAFDLTTTGFDKSWQPQITYGSDNKSPAGAADWWMEFEISFVKTNTATPVTVSSFDVTTLDLDGNGDKIQEYMSFYGLYSYTVEANSALNVTTISELVNGVNKVVGHRYLGPYTNFSSIDTGATTVMVTNKYLNTNSFRMRMGAKSIGSSGAADRMYSIWFKSFNYVKPVVSLLPATIVNWNAILRDKTVYLGWTTTIETNTSRFVIERSHDGLNFEDVITTPAAGNSSVRKNYTIADKVSDDCKGVLYYRLKLIDLDGTSKYSEVKAVRVAKAENTTLITYPNPAVSEVKVTLPASWQGKKVTIEIYDGEGRMIKQKRNDQSGQTELFDVRSLQPGLYVVKASSDTETAVQKFTKLK